MTPSSDAIRKAMERLHALKAHLVGAVAWALYVTGALHALLYLTMRKRAVVLMYHRVIAAEDLDRTYSHPGIVVEAGTFDKHLRMLRRHCHVVTVKEFRDRMVSGAAFHPRTCLITFDDGWADNHAEAFPRLTTHRLPAIIFLPTAFIGTDKRFWQETLAHAASLAQEAVAKRRDPACMAFLASIGLQAPLPAGAAGKAAIMERIGEIKTGPQQERDSLLAQGQAILATHRATSHHDTFMTWAQVREMAAAGIDFGSHGANHRILRGLTREHVLEEVVNSKAAIEEALGTGIVACSYPNGDHDAVVREAVAACGFDLGFTTEHGKVSVGDDRFHVRRINVHEGAAPSVPLLMARMAGIL
jgi:peptidoglycan/xylan/chitin deacetylase (PgdA/CDA1 family)